MDEKEAGLSEQDIQLVIVRMNQEEFGIAIQQVLEIVPVTDITRLPQSMGNFIIGMINLRGQVIPVYDLAGQFDLPSTSVSKSARIVVIELKKNRLGMLVDEVPEVLKIPALSIEMTPELIKRRTKTDFITGLAKVDNRLIIMIDLSKIELLTPKEMA